MSVKASSGSSSQLGGGGGGPSGGKQQQHHKDEEGATFSELSSQFKDKLDLHLEGSPNGLVVNGFGSLGLDSGSYHSRTPANNVGGAEEPPRDQSSQGTSAQEVDLVVPRQDSPDKDIQYVSYHSELQMPAIMGLIQKDLSEPYSIYTYRYFIHNWPKLCFLAMHGDKCVGAIVCKLDFHKKLAKRGYIAMLAVDEEYRKRKIGSNLVLKAIRAMAADDADEVVLETEITNKPALRLYENLGFVRDKRLFRYYLNGVDALRLKLWLR